MSKQEKPTLPAMSKDLAVRGRMSEVVVPEEEIRVSTGVRGLDECLSESEDGPGGLPLGISMLLSGMPGGGKSTLATCLASAVGEGGSGESLYLHGEERAISVRKRWDRLGLKGVDPWLAPLGDAEKALMHCRDIQAERDLRMVIVDSVQTLSLYGKRHHDDQFEAAEMLVGQVTGAGGSIALINHVSKGGDTHAGSSALSHLVDIYLHVTVDARRGERWLEVRKNRFGRAGYRVQLYIGQGSISVGTPAPLGIAEGAGGNTAIDRARAEATRLLMEVDPNPKMNGAGRFLTGYDFDLAAPGVTAGAWRAGLESAAKQLNRDGFEVLQEKRGGRTGYYMPRPPATVAALAAQQAQGQNEE